ncbi:hypothetical protein C7Y66_11000 [Chroococcidiopsis sp. CCALA 051]|uniref:hypothetical protein n=1 Tax=Chroococcidiopsis sp. CCALA 051 TaxID=869949 RepID=UPI000D0D2CE7|nr:hypothetical protein [Chroococcidiopsis sp. CCALA 051]MBE9018894.1 hypothetical protein [Chroococcidiopsidales cyanobacterium LEGE 13417]PSM49141.1 hypothetical protein C7Y66_11000 [Chroococcidiopsis sp. CCALA 051]
MNVDEQFYLLTHGVLDKLMDAKLTAAEWKLWAYLTKLDSWGDRYQNLDTLTVMAECNMSKATFYRAVARFQEMELLPKWVKVRSVNTIEKSICDRLHSELGGLVEVATPAGRNDLLTNAEIIEIKAIKDWKAALGQILVYSGFYPQHQKRLHLFGSTKELKALPDIEAAVLSFAVKVTCEEV